jgi:hypothetical protein
MGNASPEPPKSNNTKELHDLTTTICFLCVYGNGRAMWEAEWFSCMRNEAAQANFWSWKKTRE